MRSVFTTLALTVAAVALGAGESSAQWRTYGGNRAYSSGYNYGVQTYSPYNGLNSAYFGFGSQNYYSGNQGYYATPSYYATPNYSSAPRYNYPLYNHPTFRNAGFPSGYNRRYR